MEATDTRAPLIEAFTWVIAAVTLVVVSLRLYIKWKYRGTLWYDDHLLVASLVFLLANAGLIQQTIILGYGQHIKVIIADMPVHIRTIVMYLQVLSGLVRLSTCVARISFAVTLLQLSDGREKRFVWFAILTLPTVAIPAIIFPFVSCIPYSKIFDPSIPGICMDESVSIGYFIFEAAYTSFIDFALVVVPWRILSKLQLRRVEKLGASIAMSLGILSGVVTIIKASYTSQIIDHDFTYSSASLTVWNMIEPAAVIIAASLPNLRVFIVKNSENLKASLRIGSNSMLGSGWKTRKASGIDLDNVQSTLDAISPISPVTDSRRGEGAPWQISRERGDNDSEKSILRVAGALPSVGIVQTSIFAVEYPEERDPEVPRLKSR
ncbi:hypothetical protein GGR55DRAFT_675919 [Xylaria sp. FL0064]|nr:hypothetical protein GGR55DRAFT_675919 [Xylaria sp. FL0064]